MSVEPEAVEWVRRVAQRLGDMVDEVVFLGGATSGLLITAPRTAAVRPTKDVDIIVEVGTWGEYAQLLERLRDKGFREDTEEGAPICRWVIDDIKVDVMPVKKEVLGFSNRWYQAAVSAAITYTFSEELTVRLVTGPCFLATKIEAFGEREKGTISSATISRTSSLLLMAAPSSWMRSRAPIPMCATTCRRRSVRY